MPVHSIYIEASGKLLENLPPTITAFKMLSIAKTGFEVAIEIGVGGKVKWTPDLGPGL